jgi:dolichol-phosphate mannosyltransferase
MMRSVDLGVVCPMANERETAVRFIDEVMTICARHEFQSITFFAVLDRVSTDGTFALLTKAAAGRPNLRVIWAPENRSVVDAYVRGYSEALAAECDWILEIDAGYSHQPSDIPQFFIKMSEGYDCVFGSRFCEGGDMSQNSIKRKIISRGGSMISNLLLNTKLQDMTSGFQLFTRAALQGVLQRGLRSKGPFFQTEMKAYCNNLKIVEVPIRYVNASHSVGISALKDSFIGLWHLYQLRLQGKL